MTAIGRASNSTCLANVRRFDAAAALVAWLVAFAALFVAAPATAQRSQADAPLARAGIVTNVQGTLQRSMQGRGAWAAIGVGDRIVQGDELRTGPGARAEVDDGRGAFRLSADTKVTVSRLDVRGLELHLTSGHMIVRIRYLPPGGSVRIETPSAHLALDRPGLYRMDVDPGARQTKLVVRTGEAEIARAGGAVRVNRGQIATVATGAAKVDVRRGGGLDAFDSWSAARERVHESPRANENVSPGIVPPIQPTMPSLSPSPTNVRPVPVPPLGPAPAPIPVAPPLMPLPPMPSAPVPGTSPAPPAAVIPIPARPAPGGSK